MTPAADLPLKTTKRYNKERKGKLVIINLQKTPRDEWAHLLIRERVDVVMEQVMQHLNYSISPPIRLPPDTLCRSFARNRPRDWLARQCPPPGEDESEESEDEESSHEETSPSPGDDKDPEWHP